MAPRVLPRLSIGTALLLTLAVVSIVPLAISQLAAIRLNRGALEIAEQKYLTRSAVTLASDIGTHVRNAQTQLRKIADALRLGQAVSPGQDPFLFVAKSGLLADYVREEPAFLVLRALDKEGVGGRVNQIAPGPKAEAELKQAFTRALRGEATIGDPIREENIEGAAFAAAVPVFSEESEVTGVVQALVSLHPAQEWLADEAKREVTAFVVDRRGSLVLAGSPDVWAGAASLRASELVREFIAHPARLARTYGRDGRRLLGTLAPVDYPDWGVVVEKDEALAYASVAQMTKTSLYSAGLTLLLSAIVAAVAARILSKPVVALVEKVHAVAEGNYGQTVEVRGVREVADLAESFNTMSASLAQSVEKLRAAAKENQELFVSSVKALAAAIDAKDPYTRGHSERVARYAVAVAKHMNLAPDEIKRVRVSALLHDVGKIGIDDRILRKPTALTEEEFEIMKTHPVKGALIMGQIPQLRDVIPGIKYHHEKWTGGGYPEGLVGEEIPRVARIVAVADTFDAMTTTRPYQKAMALDYVVGRIKSFSGSRFDPEVIVALDKAFAAHDLEVVGEAARMVAAAS